MNNSNRIIRSTFSASVVSAIVASLTTSVGSLVDGIVIGQFFGVDSMAAFGLISPVLIVFSLVGATIATGARNQFTIMIGQGDLEGAGGVFTLSMVLGVGLSTLMTAAVFIFANPLCVLLGATGSGAELLEKTKGYLLGISVGLPAMNATRILSNYMIIDNDRRLPVISSIVLTAVDIGLDLVIALNGGSTFGMGLATSISYYAAVGVLLIHFRKKQRLTVFSLKSIRWKETGAMISKGLSMGVGRIANTARGIILNQILAAIATAGCIAAYSVQRQADSLLNPFIFGIADTVLTLTGILTGEENRPMLKQLTKDYVAMIGTVVVGISVLFWFVSPLFASFFISGDPEALAYGVHAARSYAVTLPLYSLNFAYLKYLEGRGKTKTGTIGSLLSEGVYIVLAAFMLLPAFGPDAVWYALPAAQVMLTLTLAVITILENRRNKAPAGDFWDWMLALPADFDVPEADRIDRSISSHEEVIALSQAAWKFCDDHGCDVKRKYIISLAVEELATNTVMTGFRPGRVNTIDMRILKKGDEYILRIRDNCEIFDPVKQLQLYDQNIPSHHIGLQMAVAAAKDVQYVTMLKLNNLVLRV